MLMSCNEGKQHLSITHKEPTSSSKILLNLIDNEQSKTVGWCCERKHCCLPEKKNVPTQYFLYCYNAQLDHTAAALSAVV